MADLLCAVRETKDGHSSFRVSMRVYLYRTTRFPLRVTLNCFHSRRKASRCGPGVVAARLFEYSFWFLGFTSGWARRYTRRRSERTRLTRILNANVTYPVDS